MSLLIWKKCLDQLKLKLTPAEFSMWIRPLKIQLTKNILQLYAPNQFALNWVKNKYLKNLNKTLHEFYGPNLPLIKFKITKEITKKIEHKLISHMRIKELLMQKQDSHDVIHLSYHSNVNRKHNFNNFIEGKSNRLARSISHQVANNLGRSYNPLFLYGKTGLGKTHLLHAIRNFVLSKKINAKIVYMNSENFIQNMVKALKNNSIEEFKIYHRSLDALLIDDIQFFANKKYFQIEFINTFNSLVEGNQQIILASDCSPKEIKGVENRLKSRFTWGLTVAIHPPELKTRTAILIQKATENNVLLSNEIALFIAKKLRANVRELEGALNKIIAYSHFTNHEITLNFVRNTLKDTLIFEKKSITILNIQKTVSKYYKIKTSELLLRKRCKSIVQPRQIAMAIAKQLTNHSLLEIGHAFGKKDHTTVLHACRKINLLLKKNLNIKQDFLKLINILST